MADRTMVAGDLEPPLRATLDWAGDVTLANSILAIIYPESGVGPTITGECSPIVGEVRNYIEMRDWVAGETDVPGVYLVQFKIDMGDTRPETIPAHPRRLVIRPAFPYS